jgi:orotate phosphoribosyltransferase-like protein
LNTKKELSARQLAKNLDVNKNTGWYLAKRIKKAIIDTDQRQLLIKIAEINEVQNSR